jgi:predicted acetyltransferase
MIDLKQLDNLDQIQPLKEAYLSSLVFPMDSYWETAVVGRAPHWLIEVDGQQAGYCAICNDKRLLQFFVADPFLAMASELFAFIIKGNLVQTASAGTFEPTYLAHCLDHQRQVEVRSYLFQDHKRVEPFLDGFTAAQFKLAVAADAQKLATFYDQNNEFADTEAIINGFGSRLNYARSLIDQGQVYILVDKNELIGVGECRISASQAPYADLGMITSSKQRRQGIGSYILAKLKQHCYQRGAKPICSCAANNLPSRKTIEKAGFITQHRLLDIQFSKNS